MAPHKSTFVYTMNGDPLSLVAEHKYLGMLINDKLSWHPHIDQLCHKANQSLGFYNVTYEAVPEYLRNIATSKWFYLQ